MADMHPSDEEHRLAACLERLTAGDQIARQKARDDLTAIACERMRGIAHRMLRTFPRVRRWDETGDVVQNAALRLYKSLGKVVPEDARGFIGLAAVQVRRELLDLAKKHAGPESYAASHETNYQRLNGELKAKVDDAAERGEPADKLERWSRLHAAAAELPEEEGEVFHMCWYLGLKQEEIAKLLDCSIRTIKRRWEAAKERMAAAMPEGKPE